MATPLPKQPRNIKELYRQVADHPDYKLLSEGTKFGFAAAANGWSWKTAENNKWVRSLWDHLYLGVPLKD